MPATIGRYRLLSELARGGMGVVWLADDLVLERPVAVKLLHTLGQHSAQARRLFEREAKAVAQLRHPNVVEIHDYGVTEERQPYMVMELLEGETLGATLERAQTFSAEALTPLLIQIAKGLDAAHRLGIVHRDLKPHNIFLVRRGADVTVKILDFGLALMRSDGRSSRIAGTPNYMSPEQFAGGEVDHRSDLWTLAVIIYRGLTGRPPFSRPGGFKELAEAVRSDPLTPVSSIVTQLGAAIDGFFERALAKDPERRFDTAQDLVEAFVAAQPTAAERGTKILVVDDEPDLELLIEQCFEDQIDSGQYQFVYASDGREALADLHEHVDVDVIVTDLRMPNMDGLSLLAEISSVAPAARAIVMSAYGDMGNIREAMNRGAFDFLTKPVDFDSLEATIDKAAREVRRLRQALSSMAENAALRMFVSPVILERLLPLLDVAGGGHGQTRDASVVVVQAVARADDDVAVTLEALNHTWDAVAGVFEARGGTVVSFLGDSLVGLFEGETHERHAATACVLIRDLRSLPLTCRVALSSGAVTTGKVGAPSRNRFDYAVFGAPVRLAHRLVRLARPGEILTPRSTADAVRLHFEGQTTELELDVEGQGDSTITVCMLEREREPPPRDATSEPTRTSYDVTGSTQIDEQTHATMIVPSTRAE